MTLPARLLLAAALSLTGSTGYPAVPGCQIFPPNNVWNQRIDGLPVAAGSSDYVDSIGRNLSLKADFGSGLWNGGPIGIPHTGVPADQPAVPIAFDYAHESDAGPYPIPADAPIEGGANADGDRHVLVVQQGDCRLYELFYAWPNTDGSWSAGSGALFDLGSNALRPDGWTSADAAGLPILPGLVRHEEVMAGEIRHAIRFTAPQTRRAYVWPARHFASTITDPRYPPMGQRFRLKAWVDISGFSAANQAILLALKRYGMMLADNGSAWYLSGAPDEQWDNDDLQQLGQLSGDDFEAVDVSNLMLDADSGAAFAAIVPAGCGGVDVSLHDLSWNAGAFVECQATNQITAGPSVEVGDGVHLWLHSPVIRLEPGFATVSGGSLRVAAD